MVKLPHVRAKLFGWHCPHFPASGLNARHEVVQRLRRFGIDDVVDQRLTVGRESERAETGIVKKDEWRYLLKGNTVDMLTSAEAAQSVGMR